MKKLILGILLTAATPAAAAPYFRTVIDPKGAHLFVPGAIIPLDQNIKLTEAVNLTPLVTHSTRDGCLLPAIVCEDWSPIAVGPSINAGKVSFVVGPVINILPAFFNVIPGLGEFLSPSNAIFAAGPMWEYKQSTNKGYARFFTGLALHF